MDSETIKNTGNDELQELGTTVRRKAVAEIKKHRKLISNLESDLDLHGDPDRWKRYGDLLLANAKTAERRGDRILVTDLYDESGSTIEIEGEERLSIAEIAEDYFRKYTKARNGARMIAERRAIAEKKLNDAQEKLDIIDQAIADRDVDVLRKFVAPPPKPIAVTKKKKQAIEFKGARRFVSTDGFEILVGKRASDNDFLTFRVARSLDTWMHAADYPGSHVVIRNAGKKVIPDRTLLEAAQLAAFYSDAREQTKAAVHYTLKKFVNKPKRAAPGLVSLASFKTLLVKPQVPKDMSLS